MAERPGPLAPKRNYGKHRLSYLVSKTEQVRERSGNGPALANIMGRRDRFIADCYRTGQWTQQELVAFTGLSDTQIRGIIND